MSSEAWDRGELSPMEQADPEMCGASHPNLDNGAPCIYLAGHLDADIPHTTRNGIWWKP